MRAVFLDRDGVLNAAAVRGGLPYPPATLDELEILEEARLGCALLRASGFMLVCVTNQPDIARGTADPIEVARINAFLMQELGLASVRVCPHDDADLCDCRKPKPGMILDAARTFGLDPAQSYLVGDRWRDIDAGTAAGCRTVFLNRGYLERRPENYEYEAKSTLDASEWIVTVDQISGKRT